MGEMDDLAYCLKAAKQFVGVAYLNGCHDESVSKRSQRSRILRLYEGVVRVMVDEAQFERERARKSMGRLSCLYWNFGIREVCPPRFRAWRYPRIQGCDR